jgi:hypothetical protein
MVSALSCRPAWCRCCPPIAPALLGRTVDSSAPGSRRNEQIPLAWRSIFPLPPLSRPRGSARIAANAVRALASLHQATTLEDRLAELEARAGIGERA